jgi:FkbM family methyltransferase
MRYAPIAVFCYNRSSHLLNLLQSLKTCPEIAGSQVYIFRDGPKSSTAAELEQIAQVDEVIDSFHQAGEVIIERSKSNKGLAESIKRGVSMLLEANDRVIVLEDDLLVSSGFLNYMNNVLNLYSDEESVMHVSGYMFPVSIEGETVFYNYTSCWGWGTWRRAWNKLEWDCLVLKRKLLQKKKWDHFTLSGNNSNENQLNQNISGQKKTWAVRWNASVELNDGFCLHPTRSLVNNLGFDGTGENCPDSESDYFHLDLAESIEVDSITLNESVEAIGAMTAFYENQKTSNGVINSIKQNKIVNRILDVSPRKIISKAKRSTNTEIEKISKMPRYTEFQVELKGLLLKGVDSASFISMWKDIFEKEIYLFEPKNDRPIIVDAGANIGLSSIYWSKKFPSAQILAYEADPKVFEMLIANLNANDCHNVKAINKALWYKKDELHFSSEGADAGKITANIPNAVAVESVSLEDELNELGSQIDLIKMDIEGAEVSIFEYNPNFVDLTEYLFVEYHSFENHDQNLGMILQILEKKHMRYKVFNEYDELPQSPFLNQRKYGEMDLQVNIFAQKMK